MEYKRASQYFFHRWVSDGVICLSPDFGPSVTWLNSRQNETFPVQTHVNTQWKSPRWSYLQPLHSWMATCWSRQVAIHAQVEIVTLKQKSGAILTFCPDQTLHEHYNDTQLRAAILPISYPIVMSQQTAKQQAATSNILLRLFPVEKRRTFD